MPPITSLHNPRVKQAAQLRRRKHRDERGRILIDGAREIGRAIAGGVKLEEVFICRDLCTSDECRAVLKRLESTSATILDVTPAVFAKIAFGDRAEGMLAVAATPHSDLKKLRLPANALIAVIEGTEKPGNIGAVARSADGAGVSALVVADPGTDLYNPNAIRASLGTIFTLPVCAADGAETLAWLREHGVAIFAARPDAELLYTQADFRGPAAIVLGAEAQGLSELWSQKGVLPIKLPMRGAADSLNVSTAAAVLFYEALRQRREKQ